MNPIISVIVPLYNSALFIDRLLDSFISQNQNDVEFIFIDDASIDCISEKLEKARRLLTWVSIYRFEENQGVGKARNFGVRKAKGDYIWFHDGDDYISNNALSKLLKEVQTSSQPDVFFFNYNFIDGEHIIYNVKNLSEYQDKIISGFDAFVLLLKDEFNPSPWNKLFKRKYILKKRIFFSEKIYHQDYSTMPLLLYYAENVQIVNQSLYNYVNNPLGVSNTVSNKHIISIFKASKRIIDFVIKEKLSSDIVNETRNYLIIHFYINVNKRKGQYNSEQIEEYFKLLNRFFVKYSFSQKLLKENFFGIELLKLDLELNKKYQLKVD